MKKHLYTYFRGYLLTRQYTDVLEILRQEGVTYRDTRFGFDRFYYDDGLYRVSADKVFAIYSFSIARPHKCTCLSFRDMAFQFRPIA